MQSTDVLPRVDQLPSRRNSSTAAELRAQLKNTSGSPTSGRNKRRLSWTESANSEGSIADLHKRQKICESITPEEIDMFTLEDTKEAISVLDPNAQLSSIFSRSPQQMKEIFGCEDQVMSYVDTTLQMDAEEEQDEHGAEIPNQGLVSLSCLYGKPAPHSNEGPIWIISRAYRDKDVCDFSTTDLVKQQVEHVGASAPSIYVEKDISSPSGIMFFSKNPLRDMEVMPDEVFHSFMDTTVHGEVARRRLAAFGMKPESARVLLHPTEEGGGQYDVVLKTVRV